MRTERICFNLVWETKPPVASMATKDIKHGNAGLTVYRIRFEEGDHPVAYVGESAKGLQERLRKHVGEKNDYPAQRRMRAALAKGTPLRIETLTEESTFETADQSRPVNLASSDERLVIEAVEVLRLKAEGIEVLNSPTKPRSEYAPYGSKLAKSAKA